MRLSVVVACLFCAPIAALAAPLAESVAPVAVSAPAASVAPKAATEVAPIRVLLAPELETTLTAQMSGRISSLNASLGASVKKGRVIVALDCSEHSARLRMAEAELVSAQETFNVKSRLHALDAAGQTEVTQAAAAADKARAQISLSRTLIAQCNSVAPFSGQVARLHVKPHQGVNAGAPLVDLVSDGPLKLRLNVPSLLLRKIAVGSHFEVSIDETGKTYPAQVTAINARVDAVAQTVELEGRIEGRPSELLPGMSGDARFASTAAH